MTTQRLPEDLQGWWDGIVHNGAYIVPISKGVLRDYERSLIEHQSAIGT